MKLSIHRRIAVDHKIIDECFCAVALIHKALEASINEANSDSPASGCAVGQCADSSTRDIRQWIDASSEASLFECGTRRWAGQKWPVVEWVQVNTMAPYGSARAKIRRWIRANRTPAGKLKRAHQ